MTATASPRPSRSDTSDRMGSDPPGVLYSFDRFSTTSTLFDLRLFESSTLGHGRGRRLGGVRACARQLAVDFERAVGHLRDRVVAAHVLVAGGAQLGGERRVLLNAEQTGGEACDIVRLDKQAA